MIKKIDIRKFGLFEDYEWNKNIGGEPNVDIFKKLNIIYGRNYSGKTTLSRIFRCIEKRDLHENYLDGEFSITNDDGIIIDKDHLSSNDNIRVYNTDFIKENLSWLNDDVNGDIKPFTLLGAGNVAATARIEEINNALGSIEEKKGLKYQKNEAWMLLDKQRKDIQEDEKYLNNSLTSKANNEIKRNPYFVKQGCTYIITNINHEINQIIEQKNVNFLLNEEEIYYNKLQVNEVIKESIDIISVSKPKLQNVIEECKELLERRITLSETLKDLVEDSVLQSWVDKGREIHREKKNHCAFCGGIISHDRWVRLDNHFSKESDLLKNAIKYRISELEKMKDDISGFLMKKNIVRENYYSLNQEEFDKIKNDWDVAVSIYCNTIDLLKGKLMERSEDIFIPKTLGDTQDSSDNIVQIINSFNQLSKDNNLKTNTLERDKEDCRKKLRLNELAKFIIDIDYIKRNKVIADKKNILSEYQESLTVISNEVVALENERSQRELEFKDEGRAAEKINSHLYHYFGHKGLKLDPDVSEETQQTKFVIKRECDRAVNLSEGECSLISFCYFIAKIEDELNGPDCGKLIIYIDDPISSLDNNHIFFMFSLIEHIICEKERYGQLFISTHNLDFLKYLKRLTFPGVDKSSLGYYIVEKRKKDSFSKCSLQIMPNYLKDYVTEYNFLFKELYEMAKIVSGDKSKKYENSFTHFYNLPNNMRKFLECYLFYRFPNTENPLKNISKLFGDHVPCLVNRVINEYSHLSWGDRGTLVIDVSEAEMVSKEILKAIKQKDLGHFEALCCSVGVDVNIDL